MQQNKIICIFGGSGFLGHYITQELARAGYRIKIASRIPESAYELKTYGNVGQIVPFQCDYNDPQAVEAAVSGCDGVINLVGILYQKGKKNFKRAHIEIPTTIAKAAKKNGVKKFIHVSALGIEKSKSKYAKSKLEGEAAIQKEFPEATILRPSVVFGAGDNFFNMFARLATFLPFLPLIGGGRTKFQPVFVGDVAKAVGNVMTARDKIFEGQIYELGGPDVMTFKQIYQTLFEVMGRRKKLVSLPWAVASIQAFFMGFLPKPLLTVDQVRSLKTDNVVSEEAKKLVDLGIDATAVETILPKYLSCYRRGGPFSDKKAA